MLPNEQTAQDGVCQSRLPQALGTELQPGDSCRHLHQLSLWDQTFCCLRPNSDPPHRYKLVLSMNRILSNACLSHVIYKASLALWPVCFGWYLSPASQLVCCRTRMCSSMAIFHGLRPTVDQCAASFLLCSHIKVAPDSRACKYTSNHLKSPLLRNR